MAHRTSPIAVCRSNAAGSTDGWLDGQLAPIVEENVL